MYNAVSVSGVGGALIVICVQIAKCPLCDEEALNVIYVETSRSHVLRGI